MRAVIAALILTIGTLLTAACGSDESAVPVTISGGESGARMWFDPARSELSTGSYEITFDNVGAVHHELAVVDPDGSVLAARSIPGGTRATFEVDLTEPGTYPLYCREPGHTEAGMIGELTVV